MAESGSFKMSPTKVQQIVEAGRSQLSGEEFEELESLLLDLEIYGLTPWINTQLGRLMARIKWELEIEPSPEWEEALIACDRAFLGRELRDMCDEVGASPIGHKKQLCARLYKRKIPEVVAVMETYLKGKTPEQIKEEVEQYARVERLPQALPKTWRYGSRVKVRYFSTKEEAQKWETEYMGSLAPEYQEKRVSRVWPDPAGMWAVGIYIKEISHLPQAQSLWASKLRQVKDRLEELHRTAPDEFYRRKKMIEQAIKEREKGRQQTIPELNLEELRDVLKFTNLLYR